MAVCDRQGKAGIDERVHGEGRGKGDGLAANCSAVPGGKTLSEPRIFGHDISKRRHEDRRKECKKSDRDFSRRRLYTSSNSLLFGRSSCSPLFIEPSGLDYRLLRSRCSRPEGPGGAGGAVFKLEVRAVESAHSASASPASPHPFLALPLPLRLFIVRRLLTYLGISK